MSLVSIITPLYNRESLIPQTLRSVQAQTYTNWECLIVDDGSTDHSLTVVQEFAKEDERIKVWERNRNPKGASTCRNIALSKAQGDYVLFLDSDDWLLPHCLAQRVKKLEEHSDLHFGVFANLMYYEKNRRYFYWNKPTDQATLDRFLYHDAPWCVCGPLYRQTFLPKNPFNESLPSWEDYELHVRLLLQKPNFVFFEDLPPDVVIREHSAEGRVSTKLLCTSHNLKHAEILHSFTAILRQSDQHPKKYLRILAIRFFYQAEYLWDAFQAYSKAKQVYNLPARDGLITYSEAVRLKVYIFIKHLIYFGKMPVFLRQILRKWNKSILPLLFRDKPTHTIGVIPYEEEKQPTS